MNILRMALLSVAFTLGASFAPVVCKIRDGLFTAYIAALLIVTMPPAWVLVLLSPRGRAARRIVRGWSRLVVRASGCRVRLTGVDRLRGVSTAVIVSNHISYIDSVVFLGAL